MIPVYSPEYPTIFTKHQVYFKLVHIYIYFRTYILILSTEALTGPNIMGEMSRFDVKP
jgi:hypothetical protein